jgi:Asp-tRNA(Asn)/Glu-tRNA(Gln) amidotransferase A subunit family amidase
MHHHAFPRLRPASVLVTLILYAAIAGCAREAEPPPFHLQEATIAGIHTAITTGQTSCRAIVEAYINRAKAYNGVCTSLVTADGAPIPASTGAVRAGAPLVFPTQTVAASTLFPDMDKYAGPPLDFGRMEATVSDPTVLQQAGMRVGIPNAGQVNALETLNIRGERSVTCKGAFDAHPSTGPLPPGAPPECEAFRQQPDALERAAELDARYGRSPDLAALPMYCVTVAFKDPYDTKDMRSTSGNDVPFAMDAPPFDSTIAARLREKGAIIYAKATSHEFNAGPNEPGGPAKARTNFVAGGQAISSWSGQACNPYDTERVPRGSSSGSGVAVGANLVTVAICEQTVASCQGPASRNNATLLLPTKGLLPDSGGIGNQTVIDRAGIIARTLEDGARVLDAIKDPATGYFDSRDAFTAVPKSLISGQPYVQSVIRDVTAGGGKPLQGMRIAVLREHMVTPTANHKAISAQIDQEIKKVLRDALGAEIVESITPGYPDDPDVPNLKYTFADAFSETLPRFMPEIFSRRTPSGELMFAVPGHQVDSYEYLLKLSRREAPLSNEIRLDTIATIAGLPHPLDFKFEMDRYLAARGDRTITSWATWVSRARFRDDAARAAAQNWVDTKTTLSAGKAGRLAIGQVGRTVLLKVMQENGIDLFVHPENTVPTPKILGPNVGTNSLEGITPALQIPRIVVPAGYNQIVYEPQFALSPDRTNYVSVLPSGTSQSQLPHPMPIAITFFAGQGDEPALLKVGSAYEAATKHRAPPPAFGPVAGEP